MKPARSAVSKAWSGSPRSQSMAPAISSSQAAIAASQLCPAGAAAAAARERCASQSLSGLHSLATRASGSGPRAATAA
eukprot:4342061-Alexandrium_andersonii.AAC.1